MEDEAQPSDPIDGIARNRAVRESRDKSTYSSKKNKQIIVEPSTENKDDTVVFNFHNQVSGTSDLEMVGMQK